MVEIRILIPIRSTWRRFIYVDISDGEEKIESYDDDEYNYDDDSTFDSETGVEDYTSIPL